MAIKYLDSSHHSYSEPPSPEVLPPVEQTPGYTAVHCPNDPQEFSPSVFAGVAGGVATLAKKLPNQLKSARRWGNANLHSPRSAPTNL